MNKKIKLIKEVIEVIIVIIVIKFIIVNENSLKKPKIKNLFLN